MMCSEVWGENTTVRKWSLVGFCWLSSNLSTELMTAHQPPAQHAALILKQLSHSKLTSITGKCFSIIAFAHNEQWLMAHLRACVRACARVCVRLHECVWERERERESEREGGKDSMTFTGRFGCLCTACHHSQIKWIHHSAAAPGSDLTARLHHAARDGATDTCQLEKNHLHRTRSKRRTRALEFCVFH